MTNIQNISGWGHYPVIQGRVDPVLGAGNVERLIKNGFSGIPRGLGRSYGDSAIAPEVLGALPLDHILEFDSVNGVITCGSGVSLSRILQVVVPKGWFLAVSPGTKYVTVGGAIASDVHGKSHVKAGSFSDHLVEFTMVDAQGQVRRVLPGSEEFKATCGGMGLTGFIVKATFRLKKIESAYIANRTLKAKNLEEVFGYFDAYEDATYSVAWIDCIAKGKSLGRSILDLGEDARDGRFAVGPEEKISVPVNAPNLLLNRFSMGLFNVLYYHKTIRKDSQRVVHYNPYFYPLDAIGHWYRLYGKSGFTQYQFVLPREAGLEGMTKVLEKITDFGRGSFLAVLKAFGKGNENYLSFPMEGYTLALDFKITPGLFEFLDTLDAIVVDYGGRVYLTKDVRMQQNTFRRSYPLWEKFKAFREQTGADKVFHSLQSERLGL